MDYDFIKSRLSPCGLHCGKCFAFCDGDISQLSKELKYALGNFDRYAERFVELLDEPAFSKYADFKALLGIFAEGKCRGCRKEKCVLFKGCKVRECSDEKEVDFCFQCPDFPCDQTGFDEHLYQRSVRINQRMKEIGAEAYYQEVKDTPRY